MIEISVVIPTIAGRGHLLERALASVEAQTLKPSAVIVQHDVTREGAAQTRNRALEQVNTEWVAWLDDDDELLPNHLEVCAKAAVDHHARSLFDFQNCAELQPGWPDLVYPSMVAVGGRDPLACPVNGVLVNPFGVPFGPEQQWHLQNVGNFIPITWLGRTETVRNAGGFPEPWADESKGSGRIEEDYGLLLKMLDLGARFVHVPARTWRYYFHDANTGGRGADTL